MNGDIAPIITSSRPPVTGTPKQEQHSTEGDYSLKRWQQLSVQLSCRADHWISSNSCNLPIQTDNAFHCTLVLDTEIAQNVKSQGSVVYAQRDLRREAMIVGHSAQFLNLCKLNKK